MDRYFSADMPGWRFALHTLVVSCLTLAPLLVLYIARIPGFGPMLLEGGPALGRFLRQVATNGLPVVFAVNYVIFFLHAMAARDGGVARLPRLLLLIDPAARVAVFIVLHALIYVLSADWFGSFGGERLLALRVVGPTLLRSALFENLSGVYLYATLLSALPLYVIELGRLMKARDSRAGGLLRHLPAARLAGASVAWRAAIAVLISSLSAVLLTLAAALIVWLQGG